MQRLGLFSLDLRMHLALIRDLRSSHLIKALVKIKRGKSRACEAGTVRLLDAVPRASRCDKRMARGGERERWDSRFERSHLARVSCSSHRLPQLHVGVEPAQHLQSTALLRLLLDRVAGRLDHLSRAHLRREWRRGNSCGGRADRMLCGKEHVHSECRSRGRVVRVDAVSVSWERAEVLVAVLLKHHNGRLSHGVVQDAVVG